MYIYIYIHIYICIIHIYRERIVCKPGIPWKLWKLQSESLDGHPMAQSKGGRILHLNARQPLCPFHKSPPAPSASHYFFSQAPEPLYPIPPPLEIDLGGRLRSSRSLRSSRQESVVVGGGLPGVRRRGWWSSMVVVLAQVGRARTEAMARRFISSRLRR